MNAQSPEREDGRDFTATAGKLDVDKVSKSWSDFVPGFLDVIRKMAKQKFTK